MSLTVIPTSRPGSAASRMTAYTENVYPSGSPGSSPSPVKQAVTKVTFDMIGLDVPSDQMLKGIFDQFDSNHNGYVDRSEFKTFMMNNVENYGAPMSSHEVDRLFAKLDAGIPPQKRQKLTKLSYDEFCVLVLSRIAM